MIIKINIADLAEKIRETYLAEASSIPEDASAGRTAGDVTESEFERAIITADTGVRETLFRFLHHDFSFNRNPIQPTNLSTMTALTFDFCGTPRRLAGKQNIIANHLSDALVQSALSQLFSPLAPDLGAKHESVASESKMLLQNLLYFKHKPIRHSV